MLSSLLRCKGAGRQCKNGGCCRKKLEKIKLESSKLERKPEKRIITFVCLLSFFGKKEERTRGHNTAGQRGGRKEEGGGGGGWWFWGS